MITVDEFRQRIKDREVKSLLDDVLLGDEAAHVSRANVEHLETSIGAKFGVHIGQVKAWIVGSAKLGFSITEKRVCPGVVLTRYRPFSPGSDIDVAIVSQPLFDLVWNELSAYAHRVTRLPWDSGALGDYLVCGWLRPDYFPRRVRLRRCDDWWDLFGAFSADVRYGRRRVRGGLFHSIEHLRRYQERALRDCVTAEALRA